MISLQTEPAMLEMLLRLPSCLAGGSQPGPLMQQAYQPPTHVMGPYGQVLIRIAQPAAVMLAQPTRPSQQHVAMQMLPE